MDLSIIIVNWNSRDYLRRCLTTLLAETDGLAYEIVVIDSASYDGSEAMVRQEFPSVRFIQSDRNLGFARANNQAFEHSTGRAVLFLNPDTEVLGPAVKVLHDHLLRLPDAGAVGCKLLNSDGSVQTSCIQSIPTLLNQFLDSEFLRARWPTSSLWGMAPLFQPSDRPAPVEAISGACVMLRREVFERIGRFSEDYFMYAEDIDLCYKVTQAGFRCYYTAEATVIHHGGSSSQKLTSTFSVVMTREAVWRFLRKTRGGLYGFGYRLSMLCAALGRLGVLCFALPLRIVAGRVESWSSSFLKWRAVLRWSVRLEESVRRYYPS